MVGDRQALPLELRKLVSAAQREAARCFPEHFERYVLTVPAAGSVVLMEGRARARRPTELREPSGIVVRSAVTVRASWVGSELLVVLCSAKDAGITRAIMQLECVAPEVE